MDGSDGNKRKRKQTGASRQRIGSAGLLVGLMLTAVAAGMPAGVWGEEDCRYSVNFRDIPDRAFLSYRQVITEVIHWHLDTARTLSSGDAGELEGHLRAASEAMEQFRKELEHSVVSRKRIAVTLDSLMGQFDMVVKTAGLLNDAGETMLQQHAEMKRALQEKKRSLDQVVTAAECDVIFLETLKNSPQATGDQRVGAWADDMEATMAASLENIRDIRKNLDELEQESFRTMGAVDHFIRNSLQGMAEQFATSTTYVFTSFKAMQTSRQYVRIEAARIRFPTLRDITAKNIGAIENNVRRLAPKLDDLEITFLGLTTGSGSAGNASWDQIIGRLRGFEQELDRLAIALEEWSLNYWEKQVGREVKLTCDLVAYQYDRQHQRVDRQTRTVLKTGETINIQEKRKDIDGEPYMIVSKKSDTVNRYPSPIHAAMAVVSASQSGEKCR
jgi:hypothetical protein